MQELIINPKFQNLLPALAGGEYAELEQSILTNGVRESIKTWNGQIVDGHNRFAICQKHDIPFETETLDFTDEDAVFEWIFINQLGRRNLTEQNKTLFLGQLYNLRKKKQGAESGNQHAAKNKAVTVSTLFLDKPETPENLEIGHSDLFPSEENKGDTVSPLISDEPERLESPAVRHSDGLISDEQPREPSEVDDDVDLDETLRVYAAQKVRLEAELQTMRRRRYDEDEETPSPVEDINRADPFFGERVNDGDLTADDDPDPYHAEMPPPARHSTAQAIAAEYGVSEKTVRRAGAYAAAFDSLPEPERQAAKNGNLSQKDVVLLAKFHPANQTEITDLINNGQAATIDEALSVIAAAPQNVESRRRLADLKNSPGARWREATYKVRLQLTSIADNGGIKTLVAGWETDYKIYWRDELRRLQETFGTYADELEGILNEQ